MSIDIESTKWSLRSAQACNQKAKVNLAKGFIVFLQRPTLKSVIFDPIWETQGRPYHLIVTRIYEHELIVIVTKYRKGKFKSENYLLVHN